MNLTHSYNIEKYAMSKTIQDYSCDYYITNYAEQLVQYKYPEDSVLIGIILNKLKQWYSGEIDRIKKGEYVHSKESHYKTFDLINFYLKEMIL